MVVRQAQVDRLDADVKRRFEDEMVVHLKTFAKRHCEVIKEEGVRKVIRLGCDNASQYGFTMRGPVRYFIELMFMFGGYFDTDVQHPWVGQALNDPLTPAEMFRADALHQKMTEYLSHVSGPQNAYSKNALRATRQMASEPIAGSADLRVTLAARIEQAYPEKCAWLGPERLRAVLDGGFAEARKWGITTAQGARLMAVLGFALGHRFAEDPLFPWISGTLNNSQITDPNVRAEKLKAKALLYLEQVVGYLERS